MILRLWRGTTSADDAERYLEYLEETGVKEYRATPGNRGTLVTRRLDGERAEFLLVTLWDSLDAIHAFAGDDIERAVYYPEDDAFLLDRDLTVQHFEVLLASGDLAGEDRPESRAERA